MKVPDPRLKIVRYPAGATIIREGDADTRAFAILTGRVEVRGFVNRKAAVLARLRAGQFFGEMNLVLEGERTATVVALEDTVLRVVTRESFVRLLRRDPVKVFPLLQVFFERLRNMNAKYLQVAGQILRDDNAAAPAAPPAASLGAAAGKCLRLEGITELAAQSLKGKPLDIRSVPFKIGRKDRMDKLDPLSYDDLSLVDKEPFQVSRNHCSINLSNSGRFFVMDRGSRLGTIVNWVRIGTRWHTNQKDLDRPESALVLGAPESPFQYRILIG